MQLSRQSAERIPEREATVSYRQVEWVADAPREICPRRAYMALHISCCRSETFHYAGGRGAIGDRLLQADGIRHHYLPDFLAGDRESK